MKLSKEKIDELKKLMAFGFCLIDRIKSNGDFTMYLISSHQNDIVELLAHCACVFDYDTAYEFKEPQTTQLLEKASSEFIRFKKENVYEE